MHRTRLVRIPLVEMNVTVIPMKKTHKQKYRHQLIGAAFTLFGLLASVSHASALSLNDVLQLAIERDLEIAQATDGEMMLIKTAQVSAALPAPTLSLSAMNFPVDTFSIDQEPMTQLQASVRQMFPPGDSRQWRAKSEKHSAGAIAVKRENRAAMLKQQLQMAWADGWMSSASVDVLEKNRILFEQTLATARANYSAGVRQARQAGVLGAQAALTRLDERVERFMMTLETSREQFGEWLSPDELDRISFSDSRSIDLVVQSKHSFNPERHPMVVSAQLERAAAYAKQKLATELGKGAKGITLSYGYRDDPSSGIERADFLSLGFTMELASLQGNTNSARLAAATAMLDQADKNETLQGDRLNRDYRQLQAKIDRLQSRLTKFRDELLPKYRQQADVTRRAFASGESRFTDMQVVLVDLLNTELDALALDAELMKAQAAINYVLTTTQISGESN